MQKMTQIDKLKVFVRSALILMTIIFCCNANAAEIPAQETIVESVSGILSSITGESHIYPIQDGSGQYILKSDGFYCLTANGSVDAVPGVHYFDHADINGTVFNGYYYHGADGKFKAGNPQLIQIQQIACNKIVFDGYYMVGNLGKMSAASQVRYLDNVAFGEIIFNGFYYFDINGRLTVEPNVAEIHMTINDRTFDGNYYFGGLNGVLVDESGVTTDGIPVGEDGKVAGAEQLGMSKLQPQLESMVENFEGDWSVYIKDLGSGDSFTINNRSMFSASLIKPFVMVKTYQDMEKVISQELALMQAGTEVSAAEEKVKDLVGKMITISDNEAYNELVRLQSGSYDFIDGANQTNVYLMSEGYKDTLVQHTLHPSASDEIGIAENVNNMTSVEDCGRLLEKIIRGECISREASVEMLDLMKNQQIIWKIPEGLPKGIVSANKTGETDISQHDIAIVYGAKTTYILCVMSENWKNADDAIDDIRSISRVVYAYLNY